MIGRLPVASRPGLNPLAFAVLSVAVGVVAGLAAFVFRTLIAVVHNLFFLRVLSANYDTLQHTPPSPWGVGVVLVPAVGAVFVVFLVKNFAPEAKGHGVPEVMDAIYYQRAAIRPLTGVIKALASAISIGSGGSVGREGPIIQIGAAFGSSSGRLVGASRWQLTTLVAAGGGAGIAATFNTPIGGVLFAAEVLMAEISVRTLVPVALATATGTYVSHYFFGDHPAFPVPPLQTAGIGGTELLPAYVGLGALTALASVAFIRALYGAEDLFERYIPGGDYIRHITGMLGVGMMAAALMYSAGHYYVEGVGYAMILDVLSGTLTGFSFLLLLFVIKLAATSFTLGSGASGGIFSPSLFMGAAIGAAYGTVLDHLLPGSQIDPATLALAGMAGMVAGATGAALTAIVMMFEMTLDYAVVLPMTLTVAVSYGLRRVLLSESIYTMKLARRGHYIPQALQANASLVHHVGEISLIETTVLPAGALVAPLVGGELTTQHAVSFDAGEVVGVVWRDWLLAHATELGPAATLGDAAAMAREDFVTIASDNTIFNLMLELRATHAPTAVVLAAPDSDEPARRVLGIVTMAHLAESVAESMEMFGD